MPFLPPSQQRQSTEGTSTEIILLARPFNFNLLQNVQQKHLNTTNFVVWPVICYVLNCLMIQHFRLNYSYLSSTVLWTQSRISALNPCPAVDEWMQLKNTLIVHQDVEVFRQKTFKVILIWVSFQAIVQIPVTNISAQWQLQSPPFRKPTFALESQHEHRKFFARCLTDFSTLFNKQITVFLLCTKHFYVYSDSYVVRW